MKTKLYFLLLGIIAVFSANAQVYTDTTGLIADMEAGIYEEYILAPASVEDTFHFAEICNLTTDAILRAQDGLGFKPVVTGNLEDSPSQLFRVQDVIGSAEVQLRGIHFTGSINGEKAVGDGAFRILTENVSIVIDDCEFFDFQGYNAIAKIYYNNANITLDSVLVYNSGGKVIQVNYEDDNDSPDYCPHMGDLTVTNSSFIKNYKRIWFELGAGDVNLGTGGTQRFNAGADNVTIDQCTFYDHIDVDVMQGRELYEFAGDQAAVKEKMSITNTIFAEMDKNLDADSASITVMDYCYIAGFGRALAPEDVEDFSKYNPTNTVTTAPVFADTADGAWDLTLQNEAELIGSNGTPIGDPRWWKNSYTSVSDVTSDSFAKVFSYGDRVVVESKELKGTIAVFDITGKAVRRAVMESARTEFMMPQGLYIVRVSTPSGTTTKKVITQ